MRTKAIGVFDSGIGGLDVLRGCLRKLPEYDYVYLGDTARVPYGSRSRETVYEFTKNAVDFLFKNGAGLVILACNTTSSEALRRIQQEHLPKKHPGRRVLGVLIPTAEMAVQKTKTNRIGVIGTEGTIRSGAYQREIKKLRRAAIVKSRACPLLVPFIEAGEDDSKAGRLVLRTCLAPLLNQDIDTLILGCTHYGVLELKIRKITGAGVAIVHGRAAVPPRLKEYLARHPNIERKLSKRHRRTIYVTDKTPNLEKFANRFFGRSANIKTIRLES